MKIVTEVKNHLYKNTKALCHFIYENEKPYWINEIHGRVGNTIKQIISNTEWKEGEIRIIETHGLILAEKVILIGLGLRKNSNSEKIRESTGKITREIQKMKLPEYTIVLPKESQEEFARSIVEGAELSMYNFDKYKINQKITPMLCILIHDKKINDIIIKTQKINNGVIFARDIANLPPNDCAPATMAKFAKSIATSTLKCRVLTKDYLEEKKFNGIISVGMGSKNEPRLIVLEYNIKKNDRPIVVVGKAVTFDTGGISLKPSDKLDEMKFDKCGGCVVLGIMKAVSELKLPISLVGIIPSVENMPGGNSYRPGDIIKMYNEKMVEIINTDAEGRLILSDAISYGETKYSPKAIIDFATLTGACITALGTNVAGFTTNNDDFATKFKESSKRCNEEIWQLPLNNDYMDMIKSDVADIKNTGPKGAAGTITAAAFLFHSINKNTPWIHVDIAGTSWIQPSTKFRSYNSKGATGFGVRLTIDYLTNN